jgi:tetratricopeptide (TPR) repeat protein
MARLFLSYSRKDAPLAQRFAEWLERSGDDVWRDDDDISGGASFSSEIEKALEDCGAVLVLWSTHSVQSAWVRDEAAYGRDSGKLIPFLLDGTDPPIGFRQFQSIDLSSWKGRGNPPAADRIRRAIGRMVGSEARGPSIDASPADPPGARRSRPSRVRLAAASILMLGIALLGLYLWRHLDREPAITIAVSASPTSSDKAAAADYASVAAADLGAFAATRFDGVRIIAPADAEASTRGYRMLVTAGRHGRGADASLTLSDKDGSSILWSKSWSIPDASATDLREKISLAASQAALCLAEARGGARRIEQPALGLYISGCVGIADPSWSEAELLATFERLVKLAPDFPRGWGGLAIGRAVFAEAQQTRSGAPDKAAIDSARQAIATTRKLDPDSGFAYIAEWHLVRDDPLRGLALLDKAVEVAPDEPLVHARRSDSLRSVGRMVESVEDAHRAVELDPLSSFTRAKYIDALIDAGQFSRAKADIAEAHRKWPNDAEIDGADFRFQYRYGDPRAAEKLLTRALDYSDAGMIPFRKVIAARLDPSPARIDDALATLRSAGQTDPSDRDRYLSALGLFGKVDEAYRLLSQPGFRRPTDPDILFRPEFAPVRADPRFMQVAAALGLVRYWRESGHWPDFCTSEQPRYDCKAEAAKHAH